MLIDIKDVCPCCNKDISFELDITPFSDPTKAECPECKNAIYIDENWLCDPECESDGMSVYSLYNFEDYCYVFSSTIITKELLNDIYAGRIVEFEIKKDNIVDILQVRSGEPYMFSKTVEEIIKLKEHKESLNTIKD